MAKAITYDDLNELIDKSFDIINEALNSTDEYTRRRMAIDVTQMLVISGFAERLKSVERWAENLEEKENGKTKVRDLPESDVQG